VVTGVVPAGINEVIAYTDRGVSMKASVVYIDALRAGFVAALSPPDWTEGAYRVDTVTADGRTVVDRGQRLDDGSIACPSADPPLRGIPDGLPRAGETTKKHVDAVLDRRRGELVSRYGATYIQVEDRFGQVWVDGPRVIEAGDYQLRVEVADATRCPSAVAYVDGVPLRFVYRTPPPAPSGNQGNSRQPMPYTGPTSPNESLPFN
jgi:hypothetical protein